MALPIKGAPVLTGKSAKKFIKMAEENSKNKGTIDFSEHVAKAARILKNAKL